MRLLALMIVSALVLLGCVSIETELAANRARLDAAETKLKAQWRSEDAARAAKENCEQSEAQAECWDREYHRHLNDPVGASAEDSKERKRRSDVVLAKWMQCSVDKARELAHSDTPAPEAARDAFV